MLELIKYMNDTTDLSTRQILNFMKGFTDPSEEERLQQIAYMNSFHNEKPDLDETDAIIQIGKVMSVLI